MISSASADTTYLDLLKKKKKKKKLTPTWIIPDIAKTSSNIFLWATIHTAPEKFEISVFPLTSQILAFCPRIAGETENATNTGHVGLCLRKTRAGRSRDYRKLIALFSKCFVSTSKCKMAFSTSSSLKSNF